MAKKGWRHPYTGEAIHATDDRLVGMGNPPKMPGAPGMGQVSLIPVALTDDEAKKAKDVADKNRSAHRRRPAGFPQGEEF